MMDLFLYSIENRGAEAERPLIDHPLIDRRTIERQARAASHGLLARLLERFLRWRRIRRDEALLLKQPDYMLRDIGIGRAEIEIAVRGESHWGGKIGPRV